MKEIKNPHKSMAILKTMDGFLYIKPGASKKINDTEITPGLLRQVEALGLQVSDVKPAEAKKESAPKAEKKSK